MGTFSIWHWLVVLAVVLVLFGGKGKISGLMGDFGKGLKSFKKGMKEDDEESAQVDVESPKEINSNSEEVLDNATEKDKAANG